MAVSVALSITAMGTLGPAVMGTVPMGVTLGVCTVLPATPPWACGLKARFAGLEGSLAPPPTFSCVQTLPVTGSRNWASAAVATVATRNAETSPRRMISLRISGGGLRHRGPVAGQGRAPHVARLVDREGPGPMHGLTVVPHHEVPNAPLVSIDELALRGVLDEIAQEAARFGHRPADDGAGMRGEIERLATGDRVGAHQALPHGLEALALLVGEIEEADLLAREHLRMLAHQAFDLSLGLVIERVVGRAHVGVLRVAALGRNADGAQQRVLGGHRLEGRIRMPQAIADGEQPPPVVARKWRVLAIEVGDVGECVGQAVVAGRPQAG